MVNSDGSESSSGDLIEQFKNVDFGGSESMWESKVDDGWSDCESATGNTQIVYPSRPGAEDCSFYMRTGSCKYGSTCKFNHPLPLIARDYVRGKEDDADKLRPSDCKYYLRTGGCKYGETCRFNHIKPNSSLPDLNLLGLPIRLGETECPYYMRNGSCKYGPDCRFDHPHPSTIGPTDSPSFSPNSTFQPTSTSFIPTMLSQSHGVPSQTPDCNGYHGSPSTTHHMNNSSAETSIFSPYQHQMPTEEFPERPDQSECSYYLKTGDCKFKFNCKYHHPKNRLPKHPPFTFNDKGLPLRPDQNICTHYSLYGICKYGPACRFDHSLQPTYLEGISQAIVEPSQVGGNGNDSDGWN